MSVICHGCGHAFPVPAGYTKNKIQCPACGVICQVPAGAASAAAPAVPRTRQPQATEDAAASWLAEDYAPKLQEPEEEPIEADLEEETPPNWRPAPPPARASRPRRRSPAAAAAGRCDGSASAPSATPRRTTHCRWSRPRRRAAIPSLELDDEPPLPRRDEEDEESAPYLAEGHDTPSCPKCRKDMEHGAVVCVSCGFNLRTRKKAKRSYAPIDRTWETDYPFLTRFSAAAVLVTVDFLAAIIAFAGGSTLGLAMFFPFLAVLSFVTGTYDTVRIRRDERGRVILTRQWRVCFVPLPAKTTPVRGFEGIRSGGWNDSGFVEWSICLMLLCMGVVPAFVWWYVAIWQSHWHVTLSENHGFDSQIVYRGRSQEQMEEVRAVLADATGLLVLT